MTSHSATQKQSNVQAQSRHGMTQECASTSTNDQAYVNGLGYLEKGTGKHQSNSVYGTDGLCPCEYAGQWKEPLKVMEWEKL